MAGQETVYRVLNIQKGEEKTILLFVAYSLFMGVAVAVFYTCSTSLFLVNFQRNTLPVSFIAGGLFVLLLGSVVQLLQRKMTFARINTYLLSFLVVSVTLLLLAPYFFPNKWIFFALFIWNRVFVFVNGITFWATASRIFNIQQAKRLFGFISMGDVISSILSYFSVPLLLAITSTEKLLFASLFFLLVCMGLMVMITRRFHGELSVMAQEPKKKAEPTVKPARSFINNSYYSLLYILALMPVFGLVYVEFMFTVESKEVFPDKESLASFLGIFFGICAVAELFIKSFLYSRLISKYTIRFGITLLPFALLFSYTLAAGYGTFFGTTSLFFAFIVLSRFFMSSVRKSISDPAFQVLFQPIPSAERTALQSRVEGGPKALGNILPGILLLGLTSLPFITLVHLAYIFLAILIFWIVISLRIGAEYRDILRDVVNRSASMIGKTTASPFRRLEPTHAEIEDAAQIPFESMVVLSDSNHPEDRVRAAHLLGQSGRYHAFKYLLALLNDDHPDVKKAAILASGALRKPELWPYLLEYLAQDAYFYSSACALLTIGEPVIPALDRFFNQTDQTKKIQLRIVTLIKEIGGEAAIRFLRARISHPVQEIRDRAIVGLKDLHYRATMTERPHILQQVDEQVALLVWLAAARLDLSVFPRDSTIIYALRAEKERIVPTLFSRLSVLYGDERFDVISELVSQKSEDNKGYLVEILNTTLPEELKIKLLPLFADVPLPEKLRRCEVNYPQQHLSVENRLKDIINKDFTKLSRWTKAVAIRELLKLEGADATAILVANAASKEVLIAETALFGLHRINPIRFDELRRVMDQQNDTFHLRLANRIAGGITEEELILHKEDTLRRQPLTLY